LGLFQNLRVKYSIVPISCISIFSFIKIWWFW